MTPETTLSSRQKVARLGASALGLLFVTVLSGAIYYYRAQIPHLNTYGYPGLFLFSILANATLIVPIPGLVMPYALGAVLNPVGVGLAAGSGAAIGELSGYLAGWSGAAIVEDSERYRQIASWMEHYGALTVFILALIPSPFMDFAGLAAGASKMPISKFLFWCWLGKVLKMSAMAFLGAASLPKLLP